MLKCHLNQCPHLHATGVCACAADGVGWNRTHMPRAHCCQRETGFLLYRLRTEKANTCLVCILRNDCFKRSWSKQPGKHIQHLCRWNRFHFHWRKITQLNNGISAAVTSNLAYSYWNPNGRCIKSSQCVSRLTQHQATFKHSVSLFFLLSSSVDPFDFPLYLSSHCWCCAVSSSCFSSSHLILWINFHGVYLP